MIKNSNLLRPFKIKNIILDLMRTIQIYIHKFYTHIYDVCASECEGVRVCVLHSHPDPHLESVDTYKRMRIYIYLLATSHFTK